MLYINVLTKGSNVFSCTGCTGGVPLCVKVGFLFLYEEYIITFHIK